MDATQILYAAVLVVTAALVGTQFIRMRIQREFRLGTKQLLDAIPQPEKYYNPSQLDGLPPPVTRYFLHVLREGQRHVESAKVVHDGQFKTGAKSGWMNIAGIEYFNTAQPGFIWLGKTRWFSAVDSFLSNKGRLVVRLFSIFKILEKRGKKIDEAELIRWVAESVWFPTALLPNDKLKWLPENESEAKLEYSFGNLHIIVTVTFSFRDEIETIATQRFNNEGQLRLWQGKVSHYRRHGGMLIPSRLEAVWKLPDGDMPYARFHLQDIQYDITA